MYVCPYKAMHRSCTLDWVMTIIILATQKYLGPYEKLLDFYEKVARFCEKVV